jgi:hypothetical protein
MQLIKRFKAGQTSQAIAASTQAQKGETQSFITKEINELNGSTAHLSKAQLTKDEK